MMVAVFPRCTAKLMCWYSHSLSFKSPDCCCNRLRISMITLWASGPKAPLVSKHSREKLNLSVRLMYFIRFDSSATAATAPDVIFQGVLCICICAGGTPAQGLALEEGGECDSTRPLIISPIETGWLQSIMDARSSSGTKNSFIRSSMSRKTPIV